mmetsp:Transcript_22208/g.37180  ORF Transcript_22208/g.37180 Transcript_22208/m.37180 type:complete len:281 (+) Transcript_22208:144-986(+)
MAPVDSLPVYSNALFYAGPTFSIGLQVTNAQAALKMLHNKSVGTSSSVPFACLLTNSLVWSLYGVLHENPVLYVPNTIGIFVGLGCIFAYESVSSSSSLSTYTILGFVCCIGAMLAIQGNKSSLGYLACTLSVSLVAAPLVTLGTVIREKSTASIHLNTSIMAFFNSLSWSTYGFFLLEDPMVYCPSSLGLLLATTQLSLFLIYGCGGHPARHHNSQKQQQHKQHAVTTTVASIETPPIPTGVALMQSSSGSSTTTPSNRHNNNNNNNNLGTHTVLADDV